MADSSPLAHSPTLAATEPRVRSDDDMRLEAGAKVGEYLVERFIGAGAMGEVYAGRHPVIGKRVAIKVLRQELAASSEAAERFIREARAANQIEHENVVDVFAFGRLDDGRLYLVMDLVEGRSLRAHLVDGPLELGPALEILDTIADAVDAAHARGVVHRDLKPDNIVLSNATPPKVFVLDFGIAKLISKVAEGEAPKTGPGTLTGAGTWLGTPGYMAPEQWSVDGAGTASDRYALGVIAFELLAGTLPYSASSVPGMMEQHFRAEIPLLSSRGAVGMPSALDAVMRKALAKDPDKRYRTARELVTALRDAAGTGALRARGAVTPPSSPRKLWIPAVAAVGVLVAGIGAVVLIGRDRGDPARPAASAHNRHAVADGQVAIDVVTKPDGAEVRVGGKLVDMTPTEVRALPGTSVDMLIRKPGYLPERRTAVAGQREAINLALVAVDGFKGVWQLPNGELRAFERRGDTGVNVYKTASVAGERTYLTQYAFQPVDQGISFGIEDEIKDPHAPEEPSCNIRMRVDYFYDDKTHALEQRREHVEIDFVNGKCVEQVRRFEATQLTRVDGGSAERHELAMPVGTPRNIEVPGKTKASPKKKATTKIVPLDPKAEIEQKRALEKQAKGKQAALAKKPTYTSPKNAKSGGEMNISPPDSQVVPSVSAPGPQVRAQDNIPSGQAGPQATAVPQQANPATQPQAPVPQIQSKAKK